MSVWLLDDNTCLNNFNYRPVALAIRAGFLVCDLAKVLDLNYEQSVEVFENVWNAASAGTWSPVASFLAQCLPGGTKKSWEDSSVLKWLRLHTAVMGAGDPRLTLEESWITLKESWETCTL